MTHDSEPDALFDAFHPTAEPLRQDLVPLRQLWVRDIAWLLHAPDMATLDATSGYFGRPTLAELGLDEPRRRRCWLLTQESRTASFEAHHQARRSHRLGIYHESLWQWVLDHAPRTRLLAHNVTLREDRQTLGELDLLYATEASTATTEAEHEPLIYHVELAIKFFLGLPEGPGDERNAARWIGIGSFDSLAIKCHRLEFHQLPKGRSPAAQHQRQRLGAGGPLHQRIIMPGFLYHPWHQRLPLPTLANEGVWQGLWCSHRCWAALARRLPEATTGHWLIKPHWLAPPIMAPMSLAELSAALADHFSLHGSPRHLLLTLPDGRHCRVFVVRNDWPPALPLPPRCASPSAH
ncbi:DUF1853 family protein [Salinicola halophyticus]|uniref:DUF1853 family protein n=1 Tax=Salinicola halophyticus TaxID=1808881 RepID=UPI000DA21D0F|nr:DUF1853 family protein [Salinicola halophyticus]